MPGKGYWVKTNTSGIIQLNANLKKKDGDD